MILGHYHSEEVLSVAEGVNSDMELLIVPSIVGSDPYADTLLLGSKSAVVIYEYTKECGRTGTKKVVLN